MGYINNMVTFTKGSEKRTYFIYSSGIATLNRVIIKNFEAVRRVLLNTGWIES